MIFPEEGTTRSRRERAELAIKLAMQNRWEEALIANQQILDVFPDDVDANNRLGKGYTELGQYSKARDAYERALALDPANGIARKNLRRLAELTGVARPPTAVATRVNPKLFLEEAGKTAVGQLYRPAASEVLAKITAGDQVSLQRRGYTIQVRNLAGDYLGQLEPRVAARLIRMMEAGNRYEAAIVSLEDQRVQIIVREVYQAPAMVGRLSFPALKAPGPRPYMRRGVLEYGLGEEGEEEDEAEEAEEEEPELNGEEADNSGGWKDEEDGGEAVAAEPWEGPRQTRLKEPSKGSRDLLRP